MTDIKAQDEDIPGTCLFNRERCRAGLHLNLYCLSLLKPANRGEFLADAANNLDNYL